MVRVSDTAVDYILAYMWIQGAKAGSLRKSDTDIADYLISKDTLLVVVLKRNFAQFHQQVSLRQ